MDDFAQDTDMDMDSLDLTFTEPPRPPEGECEARFVRFSKSQKRDKSYMVVFSVAWEDEDGIAQEAEIMANFDLGGKFASFNARQLATILRGEVRGGSIVNHKHPNDLVGSIYTAELVHNGEYNNLKKITPID